jgi:hypothetical protein
MVTSPEIALTEAPMTSATNWKAVSVDGCEERKEESRMDEAGAATVEEREAALARSDAYWSY